MNVLGEIIALSHRYGAGTDWVIAGGGNSSVKTDTSLWVKASGTTLGEITPEQFVEMDRGKLAAIWEADYPGDADKREARALSDLLAARVAGDTAPRPSVETLMHALFPHPLVFHTHPTMLNGLTCAVDGESAAVRLFGDRFVWIPTVNPGYTLAHEIRRRVDEWRSRHDGAWPAILIMQNHGLVVAGDNATEIDEIHRWIVEQLQGAIDRRPEIEPVDTDSPEIKALAMEVGAAIAAGLGSDGLGSDGLGSVALAFSSPEVLRRAASREDFAPIASAFTPDHIVYSGHAPCYVDSSSTDSDASAGAAAVGAYRARHGVPPKIVLVPERGAVALGATARKAELAMLLFLDTLKVACYAESFGGSLFMPEDQIDFIRGWEVERFRERQSSG